MSKRKNNTLDQVRLGNMIRRRMREAKMRQHHLAERMMTSRISINQLLNGRRAITPLTALKLERVFTQDHDAEEWLRLQAEVDLNAVQKDYASELNLIK